MHMTTKKTKELLYKIKRVREHLNLSQAQMADHLDICQSTYSRLESGQRSLSVEHLTAIANRLGVSMTDVVDLSFENLLWKILKR
jgi:transcriptional regulator with XRE-family HTH domain